MQQSHPASIFRLPLPPQWERVGVRVRLPLPPQWERVGVRVRLPLPPQWERVGVRAVFSLPARRLPALSHRRVQSPRACRGRHPIAWREPLPPGRFAREARSPESLPAPALAREQSPHPRYARPLPQAGEVENPHPRGARPLPQAGEVQAGAVNEPFHLPRAMRAECPPRPWCRAPRGARQRRLLRRSRHRSRPCRFPRSRRHPRASRRCRAGCATQSRSPSPCPHPGRASGTQFAWPNIPCTAATIRAAFGSAASSRCLGYGSGTSAVHTRAIGASRS